MSSITARVSEIKLDIEDLNALLESASRQKSKDVLALEIRKLQTELINMQNQICTATENATPKPVVSSGPKCYEVKLNNYAWDQTDKFVKLYVTLEKVGTLPKEAIVCNFMDRAVSLRILGLDNKNYEFTINNLCEDIDASQSNYKVKSGTVIINLAKKSAKSWACITSVEKRLKDAKANNAPAPADSGDPNDSLMSLMKKMYQDGDDEMKKTIAKAWTESQDKKMKNIPDMNM